MQRPPRDRIALIGEPLLPKLLQDVEARRVKKRCYEASETISCTRGVEGDGRYEKRRPDAKRDSAGHMGTI